jgi:hypothetical protein
MPIHPFFGLALPAVRGPLKLWGCDLVVVEAPHGLRQAVPLDWTDWRPTRVTYARADGQPVLFRIDKLVAVQAWVSDQAEKLTMPGRFRKSKEAEVKDDGECKKNCGATAPGGRNRIGRATGRLDTRRRSRKAASLGCRDGETAACSRKSKRPTRART